MEEETKQQVEETETSDQILKPTTDPEAIIDRRKNNSQKRLAMRVERYNFKCGFKNPIPNPNNTNQQITINNDDKKEYRLQIKGPKRKNNLALILILLVVVLGGGFIFINMNGNKKVSNVVPEQQEPEEEKPQEPEVVMVETTCKKENPQPLFKYNQTYYYIMNSVDNKLKKYTYRIEYEYEEQVPQYLNSSCERVNINYMEYEGYSYKCDKTEKNLEYKTIVDLETLTDKELKFQVGEKEEIKTIEENLDDEIDIHIERYTNNGYTCESKEIK